MSTNQGENERNILVVSCSLNPGSRSHELAMKAMDSLTAGPFPVRHIDLRETPLPPCDATSAYGDANTLAMQEAVGKASAILLAVPIYNYDVNSAAKNLVELTGKAWSNKIVGFLCAAGGQGSFMSVMGLANSLMLDFRCLVIPRFAYATGQDFEDGRLVSAEVQERVEELAGETVRLVERLC